MSRKMLPACFMIICLYSLLASTDSAVNLSPSGEVHVCAGEDRLVFVCTTNRSFIQWNITLVLGSGERISRTRLVASGIQVSPLVVKTKSFNITVQGSTPLISMLTAPEPINDLNGTEVPCTAIENDAITSMATVHIIEPAHLILSQVNSTEVFGIENITVILDLINNQESNVAYSVNTDPQTQVMMIGNMRAQLVLQYNTLYRVTVVACHRCSQNKTVIELHFINCGSLLCLITNAIIQVAGYNQPTVVGTNATFACPSTHALTGPNTTTCMGNGEWKPDPRLVECIANCGPLPSASGYVLPYTSTLEGSSVMFRCQNDLQSEVTAVCTRAGKWEPSPTDICDGSLVTVIPSTARSRDIVIGVASSVSAFILASVLFLTIGLAYGCYYGRKWRKSEDKVTENQQITQPAQPNPLYEDIAIQEQELELKENAAYSSINQFNRETA